jgi:outer membrane protein assembly factor BamB
MRDRTRFSVLVSVVVCLLLAASAWTEDFPQWRGPNRNGHSDEKGLLKEWPKEGPKLLWQVNDLGSGYATPSVAGGRIYLMSNRGLADEYVSALNAKDGKVVWSVRIGKVGNPNQNPNFPAARSTPTVDGALVYALGSDGDLVCLDSATGKVRWTKSLRGDFAGLAPTWAYAESPLVDGDVLVSVPGGSDATIVALDKRNGNVIWKSAVPGGGMAGYASVIIDNTGGVKQYIAYLASGLVGVEAKTGRFLWKYEKTKGSMGMSIQTPVAGDGLVYSGAGRVGGGAVRLKADQGTVTAEEAYFDPRLPTAIGGTVLVGASLYGTSQTMMCVDYKTGQVKWNERGIGAASLLYAEGLLYLHGENGEVALIEASPDAYKERGRFTPPTPPSHKAMEQSWAYPVIADGRLYIRDADTMWCYDIRVSGTPTSR